MKQSIPRIRSVRLKSGGATITPLPMARTDEVSARLLASARGMVADADAGEFVPAGFVVMAWDAEGYASLSYAFGAGPGPQMLPAFVADVLRDAIDKGELQQIAPDDAG